MSETRRSFLARYYWVPLVVIAVAAVQVSRSGIPVAEAADAPLAGSLTVRDSSGRAHRLADHRGEVVLINLWASWCGPCRREVPRLSRLHEELAGEGLVVWAVNAESFAGSELERAAAELGIDYPAFSPIDDPASVLGGGEVLPYVWLIDRSGRLRASRGGLVSEGALKSACRRLLEER